MTRVTVKEENNRTENQLYIAFELSESKWKLAMGTGGNPRRVTIEAGNLEALEEEITKAKAKFRLSGEVMIVSCYEAGRDGFWLHRYLESRGIRNQVIDPSSLEVNRRKRRSKTDRIDVEKMYRALVRYDRGEKGVFSVVRVPTVEQEDERRITREIERLQVEATAHSNRIRSLLVTEGIRIKKIRWLPAVLDTVRTWNGSELGPHLKAELLREHERWMLTEGQINGLRKELSAQVKAAKEANFRGSSATASTGGEVSNGQKVLALMGLCGVGERSAWPLVLEFFFKQFTNRREVGAAAGLVGSPYASGRMEHEQGISKAGNGRVRRIMVELSWCWLRYQPESEITCWFNERFGGNGRRMRRIGIVGVARRLLITLWRYLEFGVVPEGVKLKAAA